jgi:serine protease Do
VKVSTYRTMLAASVVALALGCGKGGAQADAGEAPDAEPVVTVAPTAPPPPALSGVQLAPLSFAPIAKQADPSVVTINVIVDQVVETWGGRRMRREGKGLGTGFIVDKDGTILTNNHVVAEGGTEAEAISVKLSNGKELPARVVGRDQPTDIAVIHIDPKGLDLKPLPLGDSDKIDVGDWVVAIGNPFGLDHTVSQGIISAKGRTKEDVPLDPAGFYDFLQTDASINPGNSGGPLLNLRCEVIGINSAIRANANGVGFAIPINMVKQLLPMLLRDGKVVRSAIGVRIADVRELSDDDKKELSLKGDKGAVVEYVAGGGPADRAGIKVGDVITAFNGKEIARGKELQWLASTAGVGKTVTVKVLRQGKPQDVKITLGLLEPSAPRRLP